MYVFPKWSLPLCVTSAEGCANQELVGPILTGTHTLGWFPEAAQMVELRSALPRGTLHHLTRHPPLSLPPSQDGWALGALCKKGAGRESQPLAGLAVCPSRMLGAYLGPFTELSPQPWGTGTVIPDLLSQGWKLA